MTEKLARSYRYARRVARSRAKNFYYAFVLLNRGRHDAMCAIYAFMRHSDDLSDEPGKATAATMARWRSDLDAALDGQLPRHPVWPAFVDTVSRFRIPRRYFHEMIDGVSSDLEPRRIRTFDELYRYCYQVASIVGLTVVHVFGFEDPLALHLAERCGIAFQLTNILRDVKEDAGLGRVYFAAEDLERFGVDADHFEHNGAFRELMRDYAARARAYYEESRPLVGMVSPECRASLSALIRIYRRLLERIEEADYRVLDRRISLSAFEKALIVARAAIWI